MMLYTKYESSGPCSFRQEIFWKLHFENLLLTPWPTYATNQNHLNNFGRGPPRDHSCEVWSKSNEWFQRRRCLSNKVYRRGLTDDAQQTTTDDGQRPVTKCSGWAKKGRSLKNCGTMQQYFWQRNWTPVLVENLIPLSYPSISSLRLNLAWNQLARAQSA